MFNKGMDVIWSNELKIDWQPKRLLLERQRKWRQENDGPATETHVCRVSGLQLGAAAVTESKSGVSAAGLNTATRAWPVQARE